MKSLKFRILLVFIIAGTLSFGISFSSRFFISENQITTKAIEQNEAFIIDEIMQRVKQDYFQSIEDKDFIANAIRGMLKELDPNSDYITEEDYKNLLTTSMGLLLPTVRYKFLSTNLGYVRINQFSGNTATELSDAINEMINGYKSRDTKLHGLIIDLRNNLGGMFNAAVDVSDLFLTKGIIVSSEGRSPPSSFIRKANKGDIINGTPMVILVNANSASASEIVAAALQHHHRALIVGKKTYGKGLVQTVLPLSQGSAIKLTTSRYLTPSGQSIHKVGVKPDILVEGSRQYPGKKLNAEIDLNNDVQLHEAMKLLNNYPIMHSKH